MANTSHAIINEQIKLMTDHVLRDIKSNMFFAIQTDEATDVACNEQMCVSVRWVSKESYPTDKDRFSHHICSPERCSLVLYIAS